MIIENCCFLLSVEDITNKTQNGGASAEEDKV